MQPFLGTSMPLGANQTTTSAISESSSIYRSSVPTGSSTLNAVNNIMTALVGNTAEAKTANTPQTVSSTMSGALGNTIGSLLKSADNKLDMSEEQWAQEVVEHQETIEHINQEFAQKLAHGNPPIGQNGFTIPGFADDEIDNLLAGESEQ